MGLPQEVVERVMHMLQDNRRALKACSLTCRAMFVSTRHLIHQTLHLTAGNNQKILTPTEIKLYEQGDHPGLALRFLPFMAERGLLRYAKHLNINLGPNFSQTSLEPHLQHFQSLDRIHTLTIHSCDSILLGDTYNPCFKHLYPTLTTLVLYSSTSHYYRYASHFILQFPNLQNLTLGSLHAGSWGWPGTPMPLVVSQPPPPPPLSGHLRCISASSGTPMWPRRFPSDLPCGISFRSIEFREVHCDQGQRILDRCAGALEKFTICIDRKGKKGGRLLHSSWMWMTL